ncbi:hypothetical protein LP419_33105 [Massilia sp. H-1]|nr:hypothetical protein LP419_33105 [Massilia sp. H-1]
MVLAMASAAAFAQAAALYALTNTEVLSLTSKDLKRDYEIFVSLPESYKTSTRRYPVVFVADANYAFPVGRALAARVSAWARAGGIHFDRPLVRKGRHAGIQPPPRLHARPVGANGTEVRHAGPFARLWRSRRLPPLHRQ